MRDDVPDRPGAAVRGYRIERLIGTGGAGAVYEARRLGPRGPGELVACKIVHEERRDECHRELVRQEAVLGLRATAGHPNLVEVLDFFDDAQEQLCIVMELVGGASVAEVRGPDRRLPFPITRRIAGEVLEALVHLHGRGVLHRDLSPRNILVTAGGAVKVTDFGLARVMEQGQVHTGTFRATPMYASREAIQLLALDARADLFSLGAVLYDLVVGMPPCGDQSMVGGMLARNVVGEFAPLPPDTPSDLAELITGLIRVDRDERRPQTAADGLALVRDHGQPIASPEELAALVGPAQARRDRELADAPPAHLLEPGHMLAPRNDRPPPNLVAGRAPDVPPDPVADVAADAPPDPVAGGADDAVPDYVVDVLPDGLAERAADAVPDLPATGASGGMIRRRLRSARRLVARRAVSVVALVACVLMLGFLLHDRLRGEADTVETQPRPEAPAPSVEPAPSPPVAPVAVRPQRAEGSEQTDETTEPHRATARTDGAQRKRIEVQRRTRRTGHAPIRRRAVPHETEPPPWGQR